MTEHRPTATGAGPTAAGAGPTAAGAEIELFVQLLTDEQTRLLHYIGMLLGDPHAAKNVLQETNLVLWRKASDFSYGTNFTAWSRKVAFWQVQAYVRDRRRDRHVFSDELITQLANQQATTASDGEETDVRIALRHCLSHLSKSNLDLLRERYEADMPIAMLADKTGKTQSAVKVGLMRLRRSLLKCIEREMSGQEPALS
ncbi:MAG: sigma-70 family RNA polymerase sigma factor [Planctomycetales bacterium]|nr:sigma-70 family RNA polymerase sigma factor [Planctomycetales bacterium]